MKINFLSVKKEVPAEGYWDHAFLIDLLSDLPQGDREVFLIPGAYQADSVGKINKELSKHEKVMVFITSDEEGKFDCTKLKHPDLIHYCQYGNCKEREHFPIGYTTETRKHLKKIGLKQKDINVFFAGQLNSDERKRIFQKHALDEKAVLFGTEGFSKGLPPEQYYDYLARAKTALTPAGHVSPDNFRFYEALEANAMPIDYPEYLSEWAPKSNILPWWMIFKKDIKNRLRFQLGSPLESTTVVVTTSPIPSHPSTDMIDETIKSIRHHLDSDIFILIDDIRGEQEDRRKDYEEYIRRLIWKCNFEYENVIPFIFPKHKHQSGMMKEALNLVDTPLILFVEHDTPLVTDEPIDFPYLQQTLLDGKSNLIRFHYEAKIPEEHKYLMIGEPENYLQKTIQWSQRPHLARTDLYKEAMKFFSDDSNCFIEDLLHGKVIDAWKADGIEGWNRWKMHIYIPGENIKRSLNLDGRKDDQKFDDRQIW